MAGRKTKYRKEYCEQAEKLCKLGLIDSELADFFGCAVSTFNEWKKRHPEFKQALEAGKLVADANVAQALYERAIGYSHPEDDIRTVSLGEGAGSEIVITPTTKHYPPDTTACLAWLHNRKRKNWQRNPDPAGGEADLPPTRIVFEVNDARVREVN